MTPLHKTKYCRRCRTATITDWCADCTVLEAAGR